MTAKPKNRKLAVLRKAVRDGQVKFTMQDFIKTHLLSVMETARNTSFFIA